MNETLFEESYLIKAGFIPNKARTLWTHPKNGATIEWVKGCWLASLEGAAPKSKIDWMTEILKRGFGYGKSK